MKLIKSWISKNFSWMVIGVLEDRIEYLQGLGSRMTREGIKRLCEARAELKGMG